MEIQQAIEVLETEAREILNLTGKIDHTFKEVVDLIVASKGRVIIGGIGKSGLIGRKIVATLNSTGTTSLFLHPVEAMHGDLGMVSRGDIFLALSNSGETDELNLLLPVIRDIGCPVVSMTGNTESTMARQSDYVIDVGTEKEACPMGLAPTSSTTALLAMGDALAVVLIHRKNFESKDFRKFHPGGSLGQRLGLDVREIMLEGDKIPSVPLGQPMPEAVKILDKGKLGALIVTAEGGNRLEGIITDGDIRHHVTRTGTLLDVAVDDLMTQSPRFVFGDTPVYDALNTMERHQITVLPVVDQKKQVVGILHLHDILGKGAFTFNGTSGNGKSGAHAKI